MEEVYIYPPITSNQIFTNRSGLFSLPQVTGTLPTSRGAKKV
jgi:hypothetical protein